MADETGHGEAAGPEGSGRARRCARNGGEPELGGLAGRWSLLLLVRAGRDEEAREAIQALLDGTHGSLERRKAHARLRRFFGARRHVGHRCCRPRRARKVRLGHGASRVPVPVPASTAPLAAAPPTAALLLSSTTAGAARRGVAQEPGGRRPRAVAVSSSRSWPLASRSSAISSRHFESSFLCRGGPLTSHRGTVVAGASGDDDRHNPAC